MVCYHQNVRANGLWANTFEPVFFTFPMRPQSDRQRPPMQMPGPGPTSPFSLRRLKGD